MSDDNPYDSLAEDGDDHRWAYGTGFTDPLDGVDTSVPSGLDAEVLATYCLMLGDDALIYSHRLQQWMTRMPELEEETALANIALDLLGPARMLLARAGQAAGLPGIEAGPVRPAGLLGRPGARRDRGQGRQRDGLPPGLRGPVGDQARRRDSAVARQDGGRARRHLAADRRALPGRPGRGPAARSGGRPGGAAGRGGRRARRRARRGHPGSP